MGIVDELAKDTIKKDMEKLTLPVTKRILAYGAIAAAASFVFCMYINSNLPQKHQIYVWIPFVFLASLIVLLNITYIIEFGIYSRKINKMYQQGIELQNKIIALKGERIKLLEDSESKDEKQINELNKTIESNNLTLEAMRDFLKKSELDYLQKIMTFEADKNELEKEIEVLMKQKIDGDAAILEIDKIRNKKENDERMKRINL